MTEEECRALLTLTQRRMRARGMEDVVLAAADQDDAFAPPSRRLLTLLDALEHTFRLRDRTTAERVQEALARHVVDTDGNRVGRVEIDLSAQQAEAFALYEPIGLTDAPDLSRALADLGELRAMIMESVG